LHDEQKISATIDTLPKEKHLLGEGLTRRSGYCIQSMDSLS
jgi:hypothetical protein